MSDKILKLAGNECIIAGNHYYIVLYDFKVRTKYTESTSTNVQFSIMSLAVEYPGGFSGCTEPLPQS